MLTVSYSRSALKTLRRMPANTARLIVSKIEQYAASPESFSGNVKVLKGEEGYFRLRVGDWRVIFGREGSVIAIVRIGPRGSVYD